MDLPTNVNTGLTSLFRLKATTQEAQLISLENKDRIPVGAIDLSRISVDKLIVCETSTVSERYYIYIDGLSVFFTYWRLM